MFESFSIVIAKILDYLLQDPIVALSLIGILFLYFGYYSNYYAPIRTEKLQLYLSGFQFISIYVFLQLIILHLISNYVTPINFIFAFGIFFLFLVLIYTFNKIQYSIKTLILKICALIAFILIVPGIFKNLLYRLDNFNWIIFGIIFYHGTMIVKAASFKEVLNNNSYDYKDFYKRVREMNISQYSVFLFPLRLMQRLYFDISFGKKEENRIKKQIGIELQSLIFQSETWINSFLILIFFYIIYSYDKISVVLRLLLSVYLFFGLTSVAIEYSINNSGFLLIDLHPRSDKPFPCRLMKVSKDFVTVILRGDVMGKTFNPRVDYPIAEISKIEYISRGQMLDET